ncbi:60S acidic ribosomal protein P2-5 [Zea mays]|uniref:60S acidic ribosomal protein P2-5 n=1 Tax=Zea mays TaxID=4577 RepID=A0A1D6FDR3_MAIZE|nr:60S acidic ribosomal protein P2-5 [Zea mays]ONM25641.1 60S acidic ribosomal protein P2-5 [Zea mays]
MIQSFLLIHVAVGCEIDNERMELMLSQLSGKDITVHCCGREKFAWWQWCGGAVVATCCPCYMLSCSRSRGKGRREGGREGSDDDMSFSLFD